MLIPRSRVRIAATMLAGALVLAGCSAAPTEPAPDDPPPAAPVSLQTDLAPGDAELVGEAVNAFGFDLLGQLADGQDNAVTSPLSAAVLLAMVLAGAGGETAEAMAQALHLDDPRDVRVGALLSALADTDDVTLSVANALWGDADVPFEAEYTEFVREVFEAGLDTADLGEPAAAEAIDDWVREKTEHRIDGIAEELGLPDPDAALVLLNAVYFLGEWTTEFDPAETVDAPFTMADGSQAQVPLMHLREQEFGYADREGYQIVRLPYGDEGRYGMEVLLPDPTSDLPQLLASLDAVEWGAAVDSLVEQPVDELALPRFELEWGGTLNDSLNELGMGPAFDPNLADFAPMSPADLYLDQVVQKTYLSVDEAGTEAAAVTGGSMGITSLQPELRFLVDRPFAFTISDSDTGTILFLGAVSDPRG